MASPCPPCLYLAINANGGHPEGWAVPAATDIAFALACWPSWASNLPTALRAFLLTLAVVDDLIVIVIIAVFFTDSLDFLWLAVGAGRHGRVGASCSERGCRHP